MAGSGYWNGLISITVELSARLSWKARWASAYTFNVATWRDPSAFNGSETGVKGRPEGWGPLSCVIPR